MFRTRDDIVVQSVEDEALLLDLSGNSIHQLNAAAALVWDLCREGSSRSAIEDALIRTYAVDPATARADVERILQQFRDAGVLLESD